jgi:hypothetical protein
MTVDRIAARQQRRTFSVYGGDVIVPRKSR